MKLNDLKIGKKARVKSINVCNDIKNRLNDLGLIEETIIENVLESPSKKIHAYSFRNTLIAIRDIDSSNIIIEGLND